MANKALLKEVRRAIGSDPCADLRPIRIDIAADGTLTLEGEVPNVAVKRLALRRGVPWEASPASSTGCGCGPRSVWATARSAITCATRWLRSRPARLRGPVSRADDPVETVRGAPGDRRGAIEISVEDFVVTFNGWGQRLEAKRLAGVLAWWVPGSRDVSNGLGVEPPRRIARMPSRTRCAVCSTAPTRSTRRRCTSGS